MPKPRPVATLFLATFLVFSLVVGLTLAAFGTYTLWQSGRLQSETEAALFQGIQSELAASYGALDAPLSAQYPHFREIHARALELAGDDPAAIDVHDLRHQLRTLSEVPLDIYIIDPDGTVVNTTYPPDEGLDFNHPALLDGSTMIERAHREDRIVVGAPVLESYSREFRVYTYSPLADTGYTFELGFISPVLNTHFRDIEERLSRRTLFNARLHFLMWDDWLLSLHPDRSDGEDKAALIEQHYQHKRETIALLRKARDQRQAIRADDAGQPRYYLHVMDIPTNGQWDLNVMAEVNMNMDAVGSTRRGLVKATLVTLAVLIATLLAIFVFVRHVLARPLAEAASAIETWRPLRLSRGGHHVRELQLLASHYNSMLDGTRSRIRGLYREARTDWLTGLANRSLLETELDIERRRSQRYGSAFSIILVDIDHFKVINDTHGHLIGDHVLRGVAAILQGRIRAADTAGRWGGEEFLVVCRNSTSEGASILAEALRREIEEANLVRGERCTASFGVAQFQPGDSIETLFTRADQTLYRAKENGRNMVEIQM